MKDELLELERAGWDSLCDSTGSEFYGRIMLPTAVMVLANGMVMDRDGPEPAFTGAMSSVYHRRDGQWRLALYQQTELG